MIHLFHRWKVVKQTEGAAVSSGLLTGFRSIKEDAVFKLEECSVCGARRAWLYRLGIGRRLIDPGFVPEFNEKELMI